MDQLAEYMSDVTYEKICKNMTLEQAVEAIKSTYEMRKVK